MPRPSERARQLLSVRSSESTCWPSSPTAVEAEGMEGEAGVMEEEAGERGRPAEPRPDQAWGVMHWEDSCDTPLEWCLRNLAGLTGFVNPLRRLRH